VYSATAASLPRRAGPKVVERRLLQHHVLYVVLITLYLASPAAFIPPLGYPDQFVYPFHLRELHKLSSILTNSDEANARTNFCMNPFVVQRPSELATERQMSRA
jgi:hypothetical protein